MRSYACRGRRLPWREASTALSFESNLSTHHLSLRSGRYLVAKLRRLGAGLPGATHCVRFRPRRCRTTARATLVTSRTANPHFSKRLKSPNSQVASRRKHTRCRRRREPKDGPHEVQDRKAEPVNAAHADRHRTDDAQAVHKAHADDQQHGVAIEQAGNPLKARAQFGPRPTSRAPPNRPMPK